MKLSVRIFIAYFLLVAAAMWWYAARTVDELKPAYLQPSEEVMVDIANLLAELAAPYLLQVLPNSLNNTELANAIDRYKQRELDAQIWSYTKTDPDLIVYVTDAYGTVLYHTDPAEIGADYHDWLDVSLTLKGEYGARTSEAIPGQLATRVAYVAAPIMIGDELAGVLSVGKPHASLQPLLDSTRRKIQLNGVLLLALALLLGGLLSWWLSRSIRRLTRYARQVRDGERIDPPRLAEKELDYLAKAMAEMRTELRAANYIEHYVHSITHEMKSPIAAIQGAVELLQEPDMPDDKRARFMRNIRQESGRMQVLIDRLLELSLLEKREHLQQPEVLDLTILLEKVLRRVHPAVEKHQLQLQVQLPERVCTVHGEKFLLELALGNLLDNAIQHCPSKGSLNVSINSKDEFHKLQISNSGEPIPDYALERIFERFYSLPRTDDGPKSSGLGLAIVREIASLHKGTIELSNDAHGVTAILSLPSAQPG